MNQGGQSFNHCFMKEFLGNFGFTSQSVIQRSVFGALGKLT